MERRKFEESWKEAFDQAEISPSENVWTNIELDLEKAKARKLKRTLVFYQLLAAASVVFAMGIGLGVYLNSSPSGNETLAIRQTTPSTSTPDSNANQAATGSENYSETRGATSEEKNNTSRQPSETDLIAGAAPQHSNGTHSRNTRAATEGRNGEKDHDTVAKANAGSSGETSQYPSDQGREQSEIRRAAGKENSANSIARASETNKVQGSALSEQALVKEQGRTGEETLVADNATDKRAADRLSQKNVKRVEENGFTADRGTPLVADNAHGDQGMPSRPPGAIVPSPEKDNAAAVYPPSFERKLPALVAQRKPALVLPQQAQADADPVALMLAKLERREQEVREQTEKSESDKKEERSKGENLWTSVGVAAGSFNPVVARSPSSSPSFLASNQFASNASKEMEARGATYSVGVNMGTRLSERWVLQGGVNYLTQTSDYTQNGLVQRDMNSNTLKLPSNFKQDEIMSSDGDVKNFASIVDTPPYNVNNSVRYLSVPMQAGYMLVNKDFGIQLNAGVSTDLLLQNNITATVDGEAVDSDYEGSDYRQVNLSGLMGTELSYRFGRRYRLALNPGIRYPFSNIYKSEDYRATRLSFDVGLRFRYIFK